MNRPLEKTKRRQLDRFFGKLHSFLMNPRPKTGWIREIRNALGMSTSDLANRLGVIRQRVDRLEKDEINDKVTLESMKKAAHAMDCEFIYFFVPRTSLENIITKQSMVAAKKIADEVEHSMKLEEQGTGTKSQRALVQDIANEMLHKNDRRIWKTK